MNIEAQFVEGSTPHIPLDPKEKEQLDFEEDDEDLCDKNLDDGDEKSKKKKRSYKKRNHYCPTIAEIKQTFHLPLEQAAQTFNICVSKLKKLCREHGITRWPYRKMKSVEVKVKTIQELKQSALAGLPLSDESPEEVTADPKPALTAPAAPSAFKRVSPVQQCDKSVLQVTAPIDRIEKPQKLKPMRKYLPAFQAAAASVTPITPYAQAPHNIAPSPFVSQHAIHQQASASYTPSYNTEQIPPPPHYVHPQQQQYTVQQPQHQHQPFYRTSQNLYHTNYAAQPPSTAPYYAPPHQPIERLPSIHELLNGKPGSL